MQAVRLLAVQVLTMAPEHWGVPKLVIWLTIMIALATLAVVVA